MSKQVFEVGQKVRLPAGLHPELRTREGVVRKVLDEYWVKIKRAGEYETWPQHKLEIVQ